MSASNAPPSGPCSPATGDPCSPGIAAAACSEQRPPPPSEQRPTTPSEQRPTLPGYTLVERIGAGGYGEVWRAEAPGGLTKAIKFVQGQSAAAGGEGAVPARLEASDGRSPNVTQCAIDGKAASEFEALNRVKQVRHPFLLSLERIEVVDGQLLIVSELADESLWDRYQQCRAEGLVGIPRDELLGYLADAADALDYMGENSSLQHLDIKPENLLLLGGRTKVADFGLVQDIVGAATFAGQQPPPDSAGDDASCRSDADKQPAAPVVGALTPPYASPEVFEGRPSIHSDQYSLAIVYQQLLTGRLPFSGRTPSQLRTQHRHGRPQLNVLPEVDRPIIARALAKNPRERFPSCRELVQTLIDPDRQRVAGNEDDPSARNVARRRPTDTVSVARGGHETESEPIFAPAPAPGPSSRPSNLGEQRPTNLGEQRPTNLGEQRPTRAAADESLPEPRPQPVRDLPPIDATRDAQSKGPTLWVGIGGTGAHVLGRLRRRLTDRLDRLGCPPLWRTLLIDTDPDAADAFQDKDEAFNPNEVIHLRLREPDYYRRHAQRYLKWLNRRWLYNIPRSLTTEGYRPLGRLALVDHADEVARAIREALTAITPDGEPLLAGSGANLPGGRTAEGRESTAESGERSAEDRLPAADCPRPTASRPRVVIVASISGGTGGGMLLDVAAMARQLLDELGLPDAELIGLLTHSTGCCTRHRELAIANAHACMREWRHFHDFDSADQSCTSRGKPTLTRTYLVPLGDNLDDAAFQNAADSVASYLALDAATDAGSVFDHARDTPKPDRALRTFSLLQLGRSPTVPLSASGDRPLSASSGRREQRPTGDMLEQAVNRVCRDVVASWVDGASDGGACPADSWLQEDRMTPDDLAHAAEQALATSLEADVSSLPEAVLDWAAGTVGSPNADPMDIDHAALLAAVDRLLGADAEPSAPSPITADSTRRVVCSTMAAHGEALATRATARLDELVDAPGERPAGAARRADELSERLRQLEQAAMDQAATNGDHLAAMLRDLLSDKASPGWGAWLGLGSRAARWRGRANRQQWIDYIQGRIRRANLELAATALQSIRQRVDSRRRELAELRHRLGSFRDCFVEDETAAPRRPDEFANTDARDTLHARICEELEQAAPAMVQEVDGRLHAVSLTKLAEEGLSGCPLEEVLRRHARQVVLARLDRAESLRRLLAEEPEEARSLVAAAATSLNPPLLKYGGAKRLLAILPEAAADALVGRCSLGVVGRCSLGVVGRCSLGVADASGSSGEGDSAPFGLAGATWATHPGGDFILCCEAEKIDPTNAAVMILDGRLDCLRMAARLQSRIDIDW